MVPRGHGVGIRVEGQMLLLGVLLLLLLQGDGGQLLLMVLLLPGHVLRVEEQGGGRVVVMRGRRRRRGPHGGLGDGLVRVAARVRCAGRGRGQDVGGRRGRRAVVTLALRCKGPGGSRGGGGGTQVQRLGLRPEAALGVRLVVGVVVVLREWRL